jgi:hypothetical protein
VALANDSQQLEEMTEIFVAPNPVKASIQRSKIVVDRAEGVVDVIDKEIDS